MSGAEQAGALAEAAAGQGWETLSRAAAQAGKEAAESEVLRELLVFLLAGTPYANQTIHCGLGLGCHGYRPQKHIRKMAFA